MAIRYKILGQAAPSAQANTLLYTVPTGKDVVVSTISVANRSDGEVKFRVALVPYGQSIATKHYIAYSTPCAGNDSTFITVGLTASAGDMVYVYADTDKLSFNLSGSEIDL
jgi:hypothetical protein